MSLSAALFLLRADRHPGPHSHVISRRRAGVAGRSPVLILPHENRPDKTKAQGILKKRTLPRALSGARRREAILALLWTAWIRFGAFSRRAPTSDSRTSSVR